MPVVVVGVGTRYKKDPIFTAARVGRQGGLAVPRCGGGRGHANKRERGDHRECSRRTYLTKGEKVKIGTADRTPRETLEERLEKTPSNARCFAQGSSLMC